MKCTCGRDLSEQDTDAEDVEPRRFFFVLQWLEGTYAEELRARRRSYDLED